MRGLVIGSHSSSFSAAVTCKRSSLVRGSPPDAHTIYALFEMDAHGCRLRAGRVSLLYLLVFTTVWRGENTMGGMELLSGMQPTFVARILGAFRILVRGVPSVI